MTPTVAVVPSGRSAKVAQAVSRAGGRPAAPDRAEGVVWLGDDASGLRTVLAGRAPARWVQLPSAGVEDYLPMMTGGTLWSRADGVQAELVAEHALMLTLTVRRGATACTRYRRWVPRTATSLHGADVVVVGGGAVARALLRLLEPFGVRVTVLSRSGVARGHGARIRSVDGIDEHLSAADVLILAAPLTARTVGLIDGARLALLRPGACVVNVGRGGLVVTDDLVAALATGRINAGLDVTDPEPLPVGHPLWDLPNCTVTAHHAGDFAGSEGAFADLVAENVRRWAAGRPPRGLVDAELGY